MAEKASGDFLKTLDSFSEQQSKSPELAGGVSKEASVSRELPESKSQGVELGKGIETSKQEISKSNGGGMEYPL